MGAAVCPRCAKHVALHEGRPFVSASGAVELWHLTCWTMRDVPVVADVVAIAEPAPVRRAPKKLRLVAAGGASIALVAIATLSMSRSASAEHPAAPVAAIDPIESEEQLIPVVQPHATSKEAAPPVPDIREQFPVPEEQGAALDELYPSLLDWVYPVAGADEKMPDRTTARFGAKRIGVMREECGAGHCGVDLAGPIGRAVVAVGDGVVVRVERSELGRDGRSGRYVRIEHDDGTLTSYMHLDTIVEGLQVGDRVDGSQEIGTLGATAINHSAPHVHFGLEVPNDPNQHGDNTNTRYVDPAPFLVRARVLSNAERKHPVKPAF
ncbi:MAG: M23 family metallopeptidase [Kofleriaceae bacterium]|nr:M23 family metallopeptidase [Kofleriaceae bacterium]